MERPLSVRESRLEKVKRGTEGGRGGGRLLGILGALLGRLLGEGGLIHLKGFKILDSRSCTLTGLNRHVFD